MLPKARVKNSTLTCPKIHPIFISKIKMTSKLYNLHKKGKKKAFFIQKNRRKKFKNFSKILDERDVICYN